MNRRSHRTEGQKDHSENDPGSEQSGKTVIAILHDMDFVAESFERVIVMAHGKVLADGTKEEVFAQKDVLSRYDRPAVSDKTVSAAGV